MRSSHAFRGSCVGVSALAVALVATAPASAQETGEGAVAVEVGNEIVVTAQRRQQNLRDVPISVSVFQAEELARQGTTRINDISFQVPNLVMEQAGAIRNQRISIRGINADTRFPGAESAVGVMVDGVYLSGVGGMSFDLADIERIEVLRGPQGTLFGRNTTAGVINIVSKMPDNEFRSSVTGEIGNHDLYRVRGVVSGPLIKDKLFASLTALHNERGGFDLNTTTGSRINTVNTDAARIILRATPSEEFEATFIGDIVDDQYLPQEPEEGARDRRATTSAYNARTSRRVYGGALTLQYDVPDSVTLKSITSYRSYRTNEMNDNDGFPLPVSLLDRTNQEKSREFTQEFQIVSPKDQTIEWIFGAFMLDQTLKFDGDYHVDMDGFWDLLVRPAFASGPLSGLLPLFGGQTPTLRQALTTQIPGLLGGPADACYAPAPACRDDDFGDPLWIYKTKSYALYGQVKAPIADRLDVTIGARVSIDDRDFSYDNPNLVGWPFSAPSPFRTIFIDAFSTQRSKSSAAFTPSLSLNYKFENGANAYATVSRGYKSPTFFGNILGNIDNNGNGQNDYLEFLEVGKETLWSYEVGARGPIGSAGRYSVAAYYVDFNNLQTAAELADPLTGGRFQFLGNADARYYGVEAELSYKLMPALEIGGSFGYNNSRFTDYPGCTVALGSTVNCKGSRPVYSPKWTANARVDLNQPIGSGLAILANAEWAYRSSQFFSTWNHDVAAEVPVYSEKGFSLANGFVGIGAEDGRWQALLWARNIFDKKYETFETAGQAGNLYFLGDPQTYGIRLSFSF